MIEPIKYPAMPTFNKINKVKHDFIDLPDDDSFWIIFHHPQEKQKHKLNVLA